MTSVNLEFRIVEDNYGISSNQYSMYAQPKESLEAFLSGKQGNVEAENLSNLIKEVRHTLKTFIIRMNILKLYLCNSKLIMLKMYTFQKN